MDLLTLAKSRINLETITDLADLLGIDANAVPKLLEEALPALLAIFKTAAAIPDKAALLDEIVAQADKSLLDDPATALETNGPEILRRGKSTLARLFGPTLTDYIAPVAKATALGEGKVASAFGALTPFITSLLARHVSSAAELHTLLHEQDVAPPTIEAKVHTPIRTEEKSYLPDPNKTTARRRLSRRKLLSWLLLLLAIALLGALAYRLLNETETQPSTPLLESTQTNTPLFPEPHHFQAFAALH